MSSLQKSFYVEGRCHSKLFEAIGKRIEKRKLEARLQHGRFFSCFGRKGGIFIATNETWSFFFGPKSICKLLSCRKRNSRSFLFTTAWLITRGPNELTCNLLQESFSKHSYIRSIWVFLVGQCYYKSHRKWKLTKIKCEFLFYHAISFRYD